MLAEIARPGTFTALWVYEPVVFPPPEGPPREDSGLAAGAADDDHEVRVGGLAQLLTVEPAGKPA